MIGVTWRGSFPGDPDQLHDVRRLVGALLAGCPVLDDAIACLAELASNAVVHTKSHGDVFTVEVRLMDGSVRVAVTDAGGPTVPTLPSHVPGEMLESGRGLAIVAALSTQMGTEGDEEGRTVWAELKWAVQDGR
ncbi:ATP-binding protein [Streptosporangium sp. NPDC049078]|uniref:ATP-binding protein n=1 Tax=Streptosporangium sp. NPDC049078 TaxID=3155767 RepID=UPI00342324D8